LLDSPEIPITPLPSLQAPENSTIATSTIIIAESALPSTHIPEELLEMERTHTLNPHMPILTGIIPVAMVLAVILMRAVYRKNQ
jgi:hypothetical protein